MKSKKKIIESSDKDIKAKSRIKHNMILFASGFVASMAIFNYGLIRVCHKQKEKDS